MNVLAELQKRSRTVANPATPATQDRFRAVDLQDSQDSQGVKAETALCPMPAIDPVVRALRAALLVLTDRLGLDHAIVHRLPEQDMELWALVPPDSLRAYLLALDDTAKRQAGKVPLDDTAVIYCAHCGPVFTHPDVATVLPVVDGWPRALGCSWCFVRKAGGYIPRPLVTCGTCTRFQPGTVHPAAGMGDCACGHGSHYPMQRHGCGEFRPRATP